MFFERPVVLIFGLMVMIRPRLYKDLVRNWRNLESKRYPLHDFQ